MMLKKQILYTMLPVLFCMHLNNPIAVVTASEMQEITETITNMESDITYPVNDSDSTGWIKFKTDYKDAPYGNTQGSIEIHTQITITESDDNGWLKISWSENETDKEGYVTASSITKENPSHREVYLKDPNGQYSQYVFDDSPEIVDQLIDQIIETNSENEKQENQDETYEDTEKENISDEKRKTDLEENSEKTDSDKEEYQISLEFIIGVIAFVMIIIIAIALIGMGGDK